jgi:hypothetical protein
VAVLIAALAAVIFASRFRREDYVYRRKIARLLDAQRSAWSAARAAFETRTASSLASLDPPSRFATEHRELLSLRDARADHRDGADLAQRTDAAIEAWRRAEEIRSRIAGLQGEDAQRYAAALQGLVVAREAAYAELIRSGEASFERLLSEIAEVQPTRRFAAAHQMLTASYREYLNALREYHRANADHDIGASLKAASKVMAQSAVVNRTTDDLFRRT